MLARAAETPVYLDRSATPDQRAEDLLQRLNPDEKILLLSGQDYFNTRAIDRLKIPSFRLSDGPQGVRCFGPSTAYTAAICLAASWDTGLAYRVGACYGRDARARGVHYLLAPGINLYRAPMNGRNFEYYGEDPVLAGLIAASFVQGAESQGVAATLKHFAANNTEFSRRTLSSDVEERALRELYLRVFRIALREGRAKAVMNSYNPLNGIFTNENGWLNNTVLKGEWGFRGLLMSDWDSSHDALAMANNGLDLEMPFGVAFNKQKLGPLLESGQVTWPTIDDKVRRQLRLAFEMGWFDRDQKDPSIPLDDPASAETNIEEARGGITLLKNEDNLLPIDPAKAKKVVVIGPNALEPITSGGGSGYVDYFRAVGLVDALRRVAPQPLEIKHILWQPEQPLPVDGSAAVEEIRGADAVIVAVGYRDPGGDTVNRGVYNEREEIDRTYALPNYQDTLIARAADLNPRVIVVLNAGGSVATASWVKRAQALLHAYYPGGAGNVALAEIVFGITNPSGKLPFSWEARWEESAAFGNYPDKNNPASNTYKEGVFLGYRWFDSKNIEPLFPFGFGLSYTKFSVSALNAKAPKDGRVEVSLRVVNSGKRAGAEVVQVYVEPPGYKLPRPPRELKAFAKVFLQPGEAKEVSMQIAIEDLQAWDPEAKKWVLVPGTYVLRAGTNSRALPLKENLALDGKEI